MATNNLKPKTGDFKILKNRHDIAFWKVYGECAAVNNDVVNE